MNFRPSFCVLAVLHFHTIHTLCTITQLSVSLPSSLKPDKAYAPVSLNGPIQCCLERFMVYFSSKLIGICTALNNKYPTLNEYYLNHPEQMNDFGPSCVCTLVPSIQCRLIITDLPHPWSPVTSDLSSGFTTSTHSALTSLPLGF